jgi:phospholipid/cholesterol/gamma-HCH transport system substrate-binding protein
MKTEYKVGIFTAIGLLIFAYLVLWLGTREVEIFKKEGYILKTRFTTLAGLEKNSSVRVAGVRVGRVKDIDLKEGMAEVTMFIYKDVKIREGSKAAVSSMGIMGEKYVEIFPGPPEKPFLKENSYVMGIQPLSIDQIGQTFYSLGEDVKSVGKVIKDALTEPSGENRLKNLILNLEIATQNLREISRSLNSDYPEVRSSFSELAKRLEADLERISSDFGRISKDINSLISENRKEISKSIENLNQTMEKAQRLISEMEEIAGKIKEGEGLASKVLNDPSLYHKIEGNLEELKKTIEESRDFISRYTFPDTSYGFRAEYLSSDSLARGYLTLSIYGKNSGFFEGEILKDPWDEKMKISFLGGLRQKGFFAKAGFIESSFGLGFGFQPLKNFELSIDTFELNRKPRPIFRAYTRVYPTSNLFLVAGFEDFALKKRSQFYFGIGFRSK